MLLICRNNRLVIIPFFSGLPQVATKQDEIHVFSGALAAKREDGLKFEGTIHDYISEPACAYVHVLKMACMYCMYFRITYIHICIMHIIMMCIACTLLNTYVCMCMNCMYV